VGNTVVGNGDSGIGVLGPEGPGAVLIAENTVNNNGRYGIEIKNPDGNGATSGGGSVVVRDNVVGRSVAATDARDHAGIAVFRRAPDPLLNADQPDGVVVKDNQVTGFTRKPSGATGDGFGIVVEGTGHSVTGNTVSGNDIGIQAQAANPSINAQSTDWFDRGDASAFGGTINRNSITGNTIGLRAVGLTADADGTCNWWGAASGPAGAGTGSGDPVSTDVTFAPWLLTSSLTGACTPAAVDTAADDDTETEGETLTASGSFTGNALTLTVDDAGLGGTFTPNDAAGTWTYSYLATNDFSAVDITVTATSTNGTQASDTFAFAATNVAPSATLDAPATADEGVSFQIALTDPADPSSVDLAGLTYAFDCGDGAGYGTPSTTASATCTIPDGPTSVTVKGKVLDDDTETEYTTSVTIENVAPTGTFGIDATPVAEGSTFDLAITAPVDVAADLGSLTYAFDCGAGYGTAGSAASTTCTTATEGPASLTVKGKVIDQDGGETEYTDTVSVTNVAPTGTLVAPIAASEGSSFGISVTGATDISAVDAANLTFAFDCGDGSGYGAASTSDSTTCTAIEGPGTQAVKAKVIDPDGGETELTDSVGTVNLNPTANFVAPNSVLTGASFTIRLNGGDDASPEDAANLTYAFDCGAGFGSAGASNEATCTAPGSAGSVLVKGRVYDPDGGSTLYTDTVLVAEAPAGSAALDPTSRDFGTTKVGGSKAFTFSLENGATALSVSGATITGADLGQFSVDASDCTAGSVPANGACDIVVTFSPTSVGAKSATLEVSHDAPGSPATAALSGTGAQPDGSLSPTSSAFGDVVVGDQSAAATFTVSNTGPVALAVSGVTLGGTNPGQFAITQDLCTGTVPASGSCTIKVAFAPTNASPAAKSATLNVATDDPDAPTLSATLTGTAKTRTLSIDPTSKAFGSVTVGSPSAPTTFTVTNTGTADVAIAEVRLTGSNPGHFAIDTDTCEGVDLSPAETCQVQVAFAPFSTGSRTAKLSIISDAAGSPTQADLTGTGVQAAASLTPATRNFGNVLVGETSGVTTFTLSNTGNGPMDVLAVALGGSNPGQFQVTSDACDGTTLDPTESCTIGVRYAPQAAASHAARLVVTTDAPGSPHRADLTGTGVSEVEPDLGTITIVMDALPDAAQDFTFSGTLGGFVLDDDSDPTRNRLRVFQDVADGVYTITQDDPAQWNVVSVSCTSGGTGNKSTRTATVTIAGGNNVTCTFTNVRRQPDVQISKTDRTGPFKGNDFYSATPVGQQTESRTVTGATTSRFWVRIQNDSLRNDKIVISSTETGLAAMTTRFLIDGVDRTAAIKAGTFTTTSRKPASTLVVEIRVTVPASAPAGSRKTVLLTATSKNDPAGVDVARATTRR
jgi:hypothetical protein